MRALAARLALHGGLWLLAFLALFALLRRPLLSAGIIAVVHALLILVSQAKARVLREPLVYADLALYLQALRHPRLYLPYFGVGRTLLAVGGVAAFVLLDVWFDRWTSLVLGGWAVLFAIGVALLLAGTALGRNALSLEPAVDVARFGLLPSLWLYWVEEDKPIPQVEGPFLHIGIRDGVPVVVVQSESFFDARRLGPRVPKDVLASYDARAAEGESGTLGVPVWGAYTMRTEYAFLSGIAPRALGVHRFNPYRRFARNGAATIARALRRHGYRTVCIHPYPASFFARDRVFPELGFDEFLDVKSFANAEKQGPYVADSEVTQRIKAALERERKVFVFAITMENHGPYYLEGSDELAIYLRHLRNADRMIAELCGAMQEGVFCLYGDHVPGLSRTYAELGYDDSRTDYLIWSNTGVVQRRTERQVHELGVRVLEIVGK